MALLDQDRYNPVIEKGKEAVAAIKNADVATFLLKAEQGWEAFPEPKNSWNQGYNYAKMVFKHLMEHRRFEEAKTWLNRMIDNNNTLQNFNYEVTFYVGKYFFETGDQEQALAKWRLVVEAAGLRYFEYEKPEYLAFYRSRS